MTRPLRIEFPGLICHITSQGDRREPIFVDDTDREALLAAVAQIPTGRSGVSSMNAKHRL